MTPSFILSREPAPRDFSTRLRRSRVHSLRQAKAPPLGEGVQSNADPAPGKLGAARANAYLSGHSAGAAPLPAAPPPAYSAELQRRGGDTLHHADNLPKSSEIRPEYQQSGHWIAQPD